MKKYSFLRSIGFLLLITAPILAADDDHKERREPFREALAKVQVETQGKIAQLPTRLHNSLVAGFFKASYDKHNKTTEPISLIPGIKASLKCSPPTFENLIKALHEDHLNKKVPFHQVSNDIGTFHIHSGVTAQLSKVDDADHEWKTLTSAKQIDPDAKGSWVYFQLLFNGKAITYPLPSPTPEDETLEVLAQLRLSITFVELPIEKKVRGLAAQFEKGGEDRRQKALEALSESPADPDLPEKEDAKSPPLPSPIPSSAPSLAVKEVKEKSNPSQKEAEKRKDTPLPSPSSILSSNPKVKEYPHKGGLRQKLAIKQGKDQAAVELYERYPSISADQLQEMLRAKIIPTKGAPVTEAVEFIPGVLGSIKCQSLDSLRKAVSDVYINGKNLFHQIDFRQNPVQVHELISAQYIELVNDQYDADTLAMVKTKHPNAKAFLGKYKIIYDQAPLTYPTDDVYVGSSVIQFIMSITEINPPQ